MFVSGFFHTAPTQPAKASSEKWRVATIIGREGASAIRLRPEEKQTRLRMTSP